MSKGDTRQATPKELLRMFLEKIDPRLLNVVTSAYVDALREVIDHFKEITWDTAIELIAWFCIVSTISTIALTYAFSPYMPISDVINYILRFMSTDPVACKMFLPLVMELNRLGSVMVDGVPTECPPPENTENREVSIYM